MNTEEQHTQWFLVAMTSRSAAAEFHYWFDRLIWWFSTMVAVSSKTMQMKLSGYCFGQGFLHQVHLYRSGHLVQTKSNNIPQKVQVAFTQRKSLQSQSIQSFIKLQCSVCLLMSRSHQGMCFIIQRYIRPHIRKGNAEKSIYSTTY